MQLFPAILIVFHNDWYTTEQSAPTERLCNKQNTLHIFEQWTPQTLEKQRETRYKKGTSSHQYRRHVQGQRNPQWNPRRSTPSGESSRSPLYTS